MSNIFRISAWVRLPDHSLGIVAYAGGEYELAEVHLVDDEGFTSNVVFIDRLALKQAAAKDIPAVRRSSPLGVRARGFMSAWRPTIGMWAKLPYAKQVGMIVGIDVADNGPLGGRLHVRLVDADGKDGEVILADRESLLQAVYRDIPSGRAHSSIKLPAWATCSRGGHNH